MRFSHFIHNLSIIGLLFLALVNDFSISTRLLFAIIFLTVLFTISFFSTNKNHFFFAFTKKDKRPVWKFGIFSFFLLFSCLMVSFFTPSTGIRAEFFSDHQTIESVTIPSNSFELKPYKLPEWKEKPEKGILSGYFYVEEPVHAILLSSSHGEAEWTLNGKPIGSIHQNSRNRTLFSYTDLDPGIHHLSCEFSNYLVTPSLAARVSTGTQNQLQLIHQPILPTLNKGGFQFLTIKKMMMAFLIAAAIFLLIPVLNLFIRPLLGFIERYSFFSYSLLVFLVFSITAVMQYQLLTLPKFLRIEADESAFGLMSLFLNAGQSPPLFHYGQNYQGTIESFLLSGFLLLFLENNFALKFLPSFWYLLFISTTFFTFWKFANKWLALFSVFSFCFMGLHFHWIFHKAWFGYSFGLFCGSILMLAALYALNSGLKPGIALLWGTAAGLSLYALPVAFPVIILSFVLIVISQYKKRKLLLSSLTNKYMLILYAALFITISPYFLNIILEGKHDSITFLAQGRTLAQPKEPGEHPFWDRFLEECFPVISGSRYPFDHQYNPYGIVFPYYTIMIILTAIICFPFLRICINNQGFIFSNRFVYHSYFWLIILTTGIGCFSPFGIWPWYFVCLYISIPVVLYALFYSGIRYSPGLTSFLLSIFIFSQSQSFFLLDQKSFQPLSISSAGLELPSIFSNLRKEIKNDTLSFIIADQGFDYSIGDSGRDWIGETLTYQNGMKLVSFDSHSRRLPDQAQLLMNSNNVAYLFHQDFFYRNPGANDSSHISITHLKRLFGENFIHYKQNNLSPYILFTPRESGKPIPKNQINIQADWSYFIKPMIDHNIGIRSTSSRAYWSSDTIPENGTSLTILLKKPKKLNRIVLFHGIKSNDYPRDNLVTGNTFDGKNVKLGHLQYFPIARASKLDIEYEEELEGLTIQVFPNEENHWLTIYELWLQ